MTDEKSGQLSTDPAEQDSGFFQSEQAESVENDACPALRTVFECQKKLDDPSLEELKQMKAIGLPTYFLSSPRDYEQVRRRQLI